MEDPHDWPRTGHLIRDQLKHNTFASLPPVFCISDIVKSIPVSESSLFSGWLVCLLHRADIFTCRVVGSVRYHIQHSIKIRSFLSSGNSAKWMRVCRNNDNRQKYVWLFQQDREKVYLDKTQNCREIFYKNRNIGHFLIRCIKLTAINIYKKKVMEAVIKQHYTKKSRLIGKFLQWEIVSYCEVEDWLDFLTTDIWTYLILLLNFTIVQFSSHDPRFSPSLKSFSFQSANEYSSVCPPFPLSHERKCQSKQWSRRENNT